MSRLVRATGIVAALAMLGVFARPADGQMIRYTGYTFGCFASDLLCSSAGASSNIQSSMISSGGATLTYFNSEFDGFGKDGQERAFDNDPTLGGANFNNAGSIRVDGVDGSFSDDFTLNFVFTSPGFAEEFFTASVTGSVFTTDLGPDGSVSLTFDGPGGNQTTPIQFLDDEGEFFAGGTLQVVKSGDDLNSQASSIDFFVTATVVPEPSTVILLGTGLLGLAFVGYRRRKELEA